METTYQIGHEALAGKIDVAGLKTAIRKHPANAAEILIAGLTEALETRGGAGGIELALQMLKAAANALDNGQMRK